MKAKTRIKILSAVLVCFALIIAVSVTCYASETSRNFGNVDDSTKISSEIEDTVDNNNQSSANAEQNVGSTSLNRAFSEMYEFASRYAAEIISAITFAGTVIIGFAYKKGLIPMLGRVTGNIQNAVVKIKENTGSSSNQL